MDINQIQSKLNSLKGWQAKYREIMLLGKQLPVLPEPLKTPDAQVKGCESNVWLHLDLDESQQRLVIIADSDTRIVKGLLAIILACYNNALPQDAQSIDAYQLFEEMGLIKHLSPSRGNGVKAIVELINKKVAAIQ
ncbi:MULTISPECIES: SufE family protein [Pseudoalteromonas]|uniref:SufE protein probably n=1 Tax=Pseudoalteromonas luteoviolacea (strain 2ta16) TaxID=1353533 RepID=V4H7A5_PSEL2|nr:MULTISPECIES: SufE family protein [Pseudoalteromonas]ESP93336.1 SufE protein probably [Pseudoalteromonas luteoviolacea 2ta16]KZN32825.1 hypothetical protein N483_26570 [Pseudoalteromonas luteoviolacea NCIMB 1944]MCG7550273.1 SufE family protein [Pseudoalteromonas sp. Of7M-16]